MHEIMVFSLQIYTYSHLLCPKRKMKMKTDKISKHVLTCQDFGIIAEAEHEMTDTKNTSYFH